VVHCSSGKDRTGIAVAILLALLGVSEADIVADYHLTELATPELVADWRAANLGRDLWPGYGHAPEGAMTGFLGHLAATHGSVPAYAAALGVDEDLVAALRRQLLVG